MPSLNSPAIMLRRMDYGDWDVIVTFLSLKMGKVAAIAKSAKKSTKRFGGVLELFSALDIVIGMGRKKGLSVLQEASIVQPFSKIRSDIHKTAYASYWAEVVYDWMEEGERAKDVYDLLFYVLSSLNDGDVPQEALSILFQMRFLIITGFTPNLEYCIVCRREVDDMDSRRLGFDLSKGGLICDRCVSGNSRQIRLQKGTIKQLQWIKQGGIQQASRIRFAPQALTEGNRLLEAFGPYHLGKKPRSLTFLEQIRK